MSVKIREVIPHLVLAACLALAFTAAVKAGNAKSAAPDGGVVLVKSAYGFEETVTRLTAAVEGRGIRLFAAVDQAALAATAGVATHPSTLLEFGNPALGGRFVAAGAGLDWPVRLLIYEEAGGVWAAYSDFAYIARRHRIDPGNPAFRTATGVVAGITAGIRR
jgi:uncharacterized protein (DUF302 family)